jgi:hypothetical protein
MQVNTEDTEKTVRREGMRSLVQQEQGNVS